MIDRDAAHALLQAAQSTKEIALQMRVSQRTIQRIAKEPAVEEVDDAAAGRRRGVGRPPVAESTRDRLRELIAADPAEIPKAAHVGLDGVQVSVGTMPDRMPLRVAAVRRQCLELGQRRCIAYPSTAAGSFLNRIPLKSEPQSAVYVIDTVEAPAALDGTNILIAFFGNGDLRRRDAVGELRNISNVRYKEYAWTTQGLRDSWRRCGRSRRALGMPAYPRSGEYAYGPAEHRDPRAGRFTDRAVLLRRGELDRLRLRRAGRGPSAGPGAHLRDRPAPSKPRARPARTTKSPTSSTKSYAPSGRSRWAARWWNVPSRVLPPRLCRGPARPAWTHSAGMAGRNAWNRWTTSTGTGRRFAPESVDAFGRNQWTECSGLRTLHSGALRVGSDGARGSGPEPNGVRRGGSTCADDSGDERRRSLSGSGRAVRDFGDDADALAEALRRAGCRRPPGTAREGTWARDHGEGRGADSGGDPQGSAEAADPLDDAPFGRQARIQSHDDCSGLEASRDQAAPPGTLHGHHGSGLRNQGGRDHRVVSGPSGSWGGLLRG
jgi:hypothetical protein